MMDHHQSQRKANGGVNVDRVNQLIFKKKSIIYSRQK